ncbi:hypothetical protein C7G41_28630 [Bradyrhizobium sp. MOS002]|nr:hypothetical protein C7G41_28630 [Bradyrhizobium sp. MOS002]
MFLNSERPTLTNDIAATFFHELRRHEEHSMKADTDSELERLASDIRKGQRHVQDQQVLIEMLERDGHDMGQQQACLEIDRARLTSMLKEYEILTARYDAASQAAKLTRA